MESWRSVRSIVALGNPRVPSTMLTDSPELLADHSQKIALPRYKGSIVVGSIGPEESTASFLPPPQRTSSIVEISCELAPSDGALLPHSAVDLDPLDAQLLNAGFESSFHAQRPEAITHLPETQPGEAPERIWNRVTPNLVVCRLNQPGSHPLRAMAASERSKPEDRMLVPDLSAPSTKAPEPFRHEGLPTEPHIAFKRRQSGPGAMVGDRRPIAPRPRIPLPTPVRMR